MVVAITKIEQQALSSFLHLKSHSMNRLRLLISPLRLLLTMTMIQFPREDHNVNEVLNRESITVSRQMTIVHRCLNKRTTVIMLSTEGHKYNKSISHDNDLSSQRTSFSHNLNCPFYESRISRELSSNPVNHARGRIPSTVYARENIFRNHVLHLSI